ncbi:putative protein-synthesizing GTPase [Helianthus annuus]|nr:putative protein-synthesizing GTPase [Helianthus annuus]
METMEGVMNRIDSNGGVYVQASCLEQLDGVLSLLVRLPVSGFGIGSVLRKDVLDAGKMLETVRDFAVIYAFDVEVTLEAQQLADDTGVRIFTSYYNIEADIDRIKRHQRDYCCFAVFPCILKIIGWLPFYGLRVVVVEGSFQVGTPLCIPTRDFLDVRVKGVTDWLDLPLTGFPEPEGTVLTLEV